MMNALIIGGAGFIGGAVVRVLREAGHDVQIAGTSSRSDSLTAARIAALDPSFDVIVFAAGGSSVGASLQDPLADFEKSVAPFARLLEHVRTRAPATRVVLLSSAAVYGEAAEFPTTESCPTTPVSPYGAHKQICEELCVSYGRNFGVASVVLRLFSVYGTGLRKQLLWDACRKARAKQAMFDGTGDEQRDWLHVDDAAALVLAAAQSASPAVPVFNGGSGAGVPIRDVVGQICRELGAGAPRFSGTSRSGDPKRYVADITRARSLGWTPRVELARGVSDYVRWFGEQE
jgi:UDP-glucose 4-epimerase